MRDDSIMLSAACVNTYFENGEPKRRYVDRAGVAFVTLRDGSRLDPSEIVTITVLMDAVPVPHQQRDGSIKAVIALTPERQGDNRNRDNGRGRWQGRGGYQGRGGRNDHRDSGRNDRDSRYQDRGDSRDGRNGQDRHNAGDDRPGQHGSNRGQDRWQDREADRGRDWSRDTRNAGAGADRPGHDDDGYRPPHDRGSEAPPDQRDGAGRPKIPF
jgi:hypothetical protein